MNNSILIDVKKRLGLEGDYNCFDPDVITGINSAFMNLADLGVGSDIPFQIAGAEELWDQFTTEPRLLGFIKEYVVLRTRVIFDPPTSSFVMESINKRVEELEWRIRIAAEHLSESGDNQ